MKNELLRGIPQVDELLRQSGLSDTSPVRAARAARAVLDGLRRDILSGSVSALPDMSALSALVHDRLEQDSIPSLRAVSNATGIVLHTNLGRSCLSARAVDAACAAAAGYSTLEYDVKTGSRGSRHSHVETLLCRLTGAQSAIAVNNNAAAVLLVLSALASGGEVITSRGELVEIGGAFRVPEIMESCGCKLREVGTTNKTHLFDYERAICDDTRALLKVHTSNYKIIGFTESVPLSELAALAKRSGLPLIEDLGSGALVPLETLGISGEPTVQDSVSAGVDVVSFSGDKLLGGPQAGIIVGKREYISRLRSHPLARAMRVDKMTLAALEATLQSYDEGRAIEEIPTLRMLAAGADELRSRAERLCQALRGAGLEAELLHDETLVGGGAAPAQTLPAWLVSLRPEGLGINELERRLRERVRPVIARLAYDRLLLDPRTLSDDELEYVAAAVTEALL